MNMPKNRESVGVVIEGFYLAALHASTAVGGSIIATPHGILPLGPMALFSWLFQRTMCP